MLFFVPEICFTYRKRDAEEDHPGRREDGKRISFFTELFPFTLFLRNNPSFSLSQNRKGYREKNKGEKE